MKNAIPVLLTVLLLLSACGQSGTKEPADKSGNANQEPASYKPEKSAKVAAWVNGVPIYEDELNGGPVDTLVTDEILYQAGLKEGLEKKYQDKIRQYQMSLVVRELKGTIVAKMPPEKEITDKDMLDYYNSNKDLSYTNYRIEEINFKNEDLGGQIIKMAKEGKSFQDIAKDLSNAESQVTVKDLGFKNKLIIYFQAKEAGSISEVISKQDGAYSVLKILEAKDVSYNSVKNAIRYTIEARRLAAVYNQSAKKIAKENGFTVEIAEKTSRN